MLLLENLETRARPHRGQLSLLSDAGNDTDVTVYCVKFEKSEFESGFVRNAVCCVAQVCISFVQAVRLIFVCFVADDIDTFP
jgi:hypothetical protein